MKLFFYRNNFCKVIKKNPIKNYFLIFLMIIILSNDKKNGIETDIFIDKEYTDY